MYIVRKARPDGAIVHIQKNIYSNKNSVQLLSCAAVPETSVVNAHSTVSLKLIGWVPMLQEFDGQRHTRPFGSPLRVTASSLGRQSNEYQVVVKYRSIGVVSAAVCAWSTDMVPVLTLDDETLSVSL